MSLSTDLNAKYGRSYLTFKDVDRAQKDISVFDDGMSGSLSSSEDEAFTQLIQAKLIDADVLSGFYVVDEDDIVEGLSQTAKNSDNPKETLEFKGEVENYKQIAEDANLVYVTQAQSDLADLMVTRIKKSSTWQNNLSGDSFTEIISSETVGDGEFSGSVDVIDGSIFSFKATTNEADEWEDEVYLKNYDMEAYINYVATGKSTYWIVQETTPPYLPAFYKSGSSILSAGQTKLESVLDRIQDFLDNYPTDADEYSYAKTL